MTNEKRNEKISENSVVTRQQADEDGESYDSNETIWEVESDQVLLDYDNFVEDPDEYMEMVEDDDDM